MKRTLKETIDKIKQQNKEKKEKKQKEREQQQIKKKITGRVVSAYMGFPPAREQDEDLTESWSPTSEVYLPSREQHEDLKRIVREKINEEYKELLPIIDKVFKFEYEAGPLALGCFPIDPAENRLVCQIGDEEHRRTKGYLLLEASIDEQTKKLDDLFLATYDEKYDAIDRICISDRKDSMDESLAQLYPTKLDNYESYIHCSGKHYSVDPRKPKCREGFLDISEGAGSVPLEDGRNNFERLINTCPVTFKKVMNEMNETINKIALEEEMFLKNN